MDFNEARDDGVAPSSAGTYANDLHLTSAAHHTIFYRPGSVPDT